MSNLRELTNAELDLVSGGATAIFRPEPARPVGFGGNPVVTLVEDIIRIVEGLEGCNSGRMQLSAK
jgi:hypothetical protein